MKTQLSFKLRFAALLTALLLCFIGSSAKAQTPTLQTTFNSSGLATIVYNGQTLYNPPIGKGEAFDIDGGGSTGQSWNATTKTLTWTYSWGNVACKYVRPANQPTWLNLEIKVTNTSSNAVSGLNIFPLRVDFPQQNPVGFGNDGYHVSFNTDGPGVQNADYGTGNLTLVNQDVVKPLLVGFTASGPNTVSYHRFGILVSSNPWAYGYHSTEWPNFNRTIPAGTAPNNTDTYKISLRFSPSGTDTYAVAGDIYSQYSNTNSSQVNWPDRRPLGALFVSSAGAHPTNNPRGWLNNDTNINVNTSAGLSAFRTKILKYADDSIAILKDTGAQGMVTWDIEGQEFPHAISYIGDPRLVVNLAPEMNSVADAYFQKFRDAGLRVGICIRPQQLRTAPSPNGTTVTSGSPKPTSNPTQEDVANIASQILAKLDYAKNRWGCTIFYVDSNTGARNTADVEAFKTVSALRPDVLLIPEHHSFKYYAYTAPYYDFNNLGVTTPHTPDDVRRTYPNAFSVIRVGENPQIDERRADLINAVREGDVLMFRAWYDSGEAPRIKSIYEEANPLVVTTLSDVVANDGKVSLREAITYANGHPGGDLISFAPNLSGVIKLNGTALPTLTEYCYFQGPGGDQITIDGDAKSRLFYVSTGTNITFVGLAFTGGQTGPENQSGGAFFNSGTLTFSHCIISGNHAEEGGAIYNGGTLNVVNSVLNDNIAGAKGGAIANNNGTMTIENSTLSGNTILGSPDRCGGGAINSFNGNADINSVVNISFCTIASNSAPNVVGGTRSGIWLQGGTLSIANSIVATNGVRDIQRDGGTISSGGFNLIGNSGGAPGFVSSDRSGLNPVLGPLQYNGGPTKTHALLSGSPAINAANPNVVDGYDQRGNLFPRVLNGRADVGAFESNFTGPSSGNS